MSQDRATHEEVFLGQGRQSGLDGAASMRNSGGHGVLLMPENGVALPGPHLGPAADLG